MPSSRVKAEMLRVKQNLLVGHSMSHRNDVVHMCERALAMAQSVGLKSSLPTQIAKTDYYGIYHYFEQISTVILAWCFIAIARYYVYFGKCCVIGLLASPKKSCRQDSSVTKCMSNPSVLRSTSIRIHNALFDSRSSRIVL
jgi:hypothetical protein